jgi:Family of unknown function (DUF6636)
MGRDRPTIWLSVVTLTVVFATTACGGSSGSTVTTTATVTVTAPSSTGTQTDTTAPPGSTTEPPATTPDRLAAQCGPRPVCDDFATPSGNISCFASAGQHGFVECAIKSGLVPPPPRDGCDLEQPGLSLSSTGPAKPTCRSDPSPAWFDKQIPTLPYGTTWAGFGVSCLSESTGLRCTNRDGRGFLLAREQWSTF